MGTMTRPLIEYVGTQGSPVVWLTGLSSAGKTTLATQLVERLRERGAKAELLDGDVLRKQFWRELRFTKSDRIENMRRIGLLASLLSRHGVTVFVAAISPYRSVRDELRRSIPNFVEVFVNAPLQVCELRDVKGLYVEARKGQIAHFTGVDDPYEPPLNPDVECRTDSETVAQSSEKVWQYLHQQPTQSRLDRTWNESTEADLQE